MSYKLVSYIKHKWDWLKKIKIDKIRKDKDIVPYFFFINQCIIKDGVLEHNMKRNDKQGIALFKIHVMFF